MNMSLLIVASLSLIGLGAVVTYVIASFVPLPVLMLAKAHGRFGAIVSLPQEGCCCGHRICARSSHAGTGLAGRRRG